MKVTQSYTNHVDAAYRDVLKLSDKYGGASASAMAYSSRNVPNALTGEFIVTGAHKARKAGNLARAIVIFASVHNTQNVWHVTPTGRKLVIRK